MNPELLRNSLEQIKDPQLDQSLKAARMFKGLQLDGDKLTIQITLPTPAYPDRSGLENKIVQQAKTLAPNLTDVKVEFDWVVKGKQSGGAIGLSVKNVIAVGSGKGGVGKSTVAACLAYGLKHFGAKVGLMDADIYGPSIPHMVGAQGQPLVAQRTNKDGSTIDRIQPVVAQGMPLMSIGFMVPEDQAVIWRGPMLTKLLQQFLKDTDWGDLDYLVIDLPPGTGDVALTLSQMLGLAGAVVVCTPQKVALLDAIKAINMFKKLESPVLGMVENMAGEAFGQGGATQKAKDMGVTSLATLEMTPAIRELADEGNIAELFAENHPAREPLLRMTEQIAIQIAKNLKGASTLPTLEIL